MNPSDGLNASRTLDAPPLIASLCTDRERFDAQSDRRDGATRRGTWRSPDQDTPHGIFMARLHQEKRRSERYGAPLSIVVYTIDKSAPVNADRLLEALHDAKRETDILGHFENEIVVLCPNTDEQGLAGFTRKIEERTSFACPSAASATYPDRLFDNLAKGIPLGSLPIPQKAAALGRLLPPGYRLKRCLDIAGALTALLLLSPVMLLTAAAVALGSRGPVIFKQRRLGLGGVPFIFYKFRSMRSGTDDRVHREFVANLIKGETGSGSVSRSTSARYKLRADPRVTTVGRLIRKTSIDELPQFFNVLKGDMSLVGPRPPLPYEAANYQPWHLRRLLAVRPGMTGLWQVEGRSKVTFDEMVRMDLRYIRACSLALDLKILAKTVLVVIRADGAV